MSNEADRDKRQRLEEARLRLLDEHLNPVYLEAAEIDRAAVRQLDAPNYYELYERFGFNLDVGRRGVPGAARRHREALGARGRPALPRAARNRARRRHGRGTSPRLFRASELDELYPSDRMLPALESTLADLGIDLRGAGERASRSRLAPVEVAARVLRADRGAGQGDARDPADRRQGRLGGAVPRGGPHRALREHERRPADGSSPARRHGGHRRLGDAAAASRHRLGVVEPAARRPAGRPSSRTTAPSRSSTSSAATRRSSCTRSSTSRRPTSSRCAAATSRS